MKHIDVPRQGKLFCCALRTEPWERNTRTCVSSNVSLQEPGPGEALATVGTLAALVMSPHVHGEGRHGHIHLVTVGTAPSLLVTQRPVRLAVSG